MPTSPPNTAADAIDGEITRVTFYRDGYGILTVRAADGTLHTVKGSCATPHAGQYVECQGIMRTHETYGPFLAATRIIEVLPTSPAAVERYLAHARIPGIGARTASKLVATFGEDVFRVLDEEPDRLSEVPRLPKKTREKIAEGWKATRVTYKVMLFLSSIGIQPGMATKIVRHLGGEKPDEADIIVQIRHNPYCLTAVSGVGFLSADRAALELGIARNAHIRIAAGIIYGLEQLALLGNTLSTQRSLFETTAKLLGLEPEQIQAEYDYQLLERNPEITPVLLNGVPCVALSYARNAELGIARELIRIQAAGRPRFTPDDAAVRKAIAHVARPLDPTQQRAAYQALSSPFSVITGGPGMGKTTLVRLIAGTAAKHGAVVNLCAPTGRAAKRLRKTSGFDASTIHRLLRSVRSSQRPGESPPQLDCDLLIVDECSMGDIYIFYALLQAVRNGTCVLLIGDTNQLPSVGPGNVLGDIIGSAHVPVVQLTIVYRYGKNSGIKIAANAIIHGEVPRSSGHEFIVSGQDNDAAAAETILATVTKATAAGYSPDDIQVLSAMRKGTLGVTALNAQLQTLLNPPREDAAEIVRGDTHFRVGDRVMQLHNNEDLDIANGDIGTIMSITADGDTHRIIVNFDDVPVELKPDHLGDVTLAYACTIHKSQGGECPIVLLAMSMGHFVMLNRNLYYTAITRAQERAILIGSRKALAIAAHTRMNDNRVTSLEDAIQAAERQHRAAA